MAELKDVQESLVHQLTNSAWFGYPCGGTQTKERDLSHAVIGLSGETGELSELIKKIVYRGKPHDTTEVLSELGDVLWYLTALTVLSGFTLEEVWQYNCTKLDHRRANGKNGKPWEG